MNIQEIIVALLFVVALIFVGRRLYKSVTEKNCSKGCGACSSIDFSKIDTRELEEKWKKVN